MFVNFNSDHSTKSMCLFAQPLLNGVAALNACHQPPTEDPVDSALLLLL
jgi:hypothetical protein